MRNLIFAILIMMSFLTISCSMGDQESVSEMADARGSSPVEQFDDEQKGDIEPDRIKGLTFDASLEEIENHFDEDKLISPALSEDDQESLSRIRSMRVKDKFIEFESEIVAVNELSRVAEKAEPLSEDVFMSSIMPSMEDKSFYGVESEESNLEVSEDLRSSARIVPESGRGRVLDALAGGEAPNIVENMKKAKEDKEEIQEFRIRSRFPEVMFYHPNLITDNQGQTGIAFQVSDEITEYLIRAEASTQYGEWGDVEKSFRVFQPFFVDFEPPQRLHKNDRIRTSVAVYNYSDRSYLADIAIRHSDHVIIESTKRGRISIPAGKSVEFPLSFLVTNVGEVSITVSAESDNIRDSIQRKIEVLPDKPEHLINLSGRLFQNENTVSIDIPESGEILRNDFRLRVFNDPSMGALAFVREISNAPHSDLETASSMLMASAMAYSAINKEALLSHDLMHELNMYIDEGWIRLLAFRNHDGFAMYPGGQSQPAADLLVLESLGILQSSRVIDTDLKSVLITSAKEVIDGGYDLSLKLHAATLIAENTRLDSSTKQNLMDLLNSSEVKTSTDVSIIGLAARLTIVLESKSNLENYFSKMSGLDRLNIRQNCAGVAFGVGNLIFALTKGKETVNESELNTLIDILADVSLSSKNSPLDRCYGIMALIRISDKTISRSVIDNISVNGQRINVNSKSLMNETPLNLKPGRNEIEIQTQLPNNLYQITGRYFSNEDHQPEILVDLVYRVEASKQGVLFVDVKINETITFRGARIHIPLAAGLKPIDSSWELASKAGANYAEIKVNEIILYYSKDMKSSSHTFVIPMVYDIKGEFYVPPPYMESDEQSVKRSTGRGVRISLL